MQNAETLNTEQIRKFLEAGEALAFAGQSRAETYAWAQQLLVAQEYARLAKISVGHLYNLRNSISYRKQAAVWEPTRTAAVSIGERRKPEPKGRTP